MSPSCPVSAPPSGKAAVGRVLQLGGVTGADGAPLASAGGEPQMSLAVRVWGRAEPLAGILSWSPLGDTGMSPCLASSLLHAP